MISSHFLEALFSETKSIIHSKLGIDISIDRSGITSYAKDALIIPIVAYGHRYHIHHYVNPQWSVQRQAWEIGQQLFHKRIKDKDR